MAKKPKEEKKLSSRTLLEFTALIFLYGKVVHDKVREHRINELHELFYKRIPEKRGFFARITSFFRRLAGR